MALLNADVLRAKIHGSVRIQRRCFLMTQLNCCGAVGPQDYHYSMWFNNTDHTQGPFVPQSCCRALRYAYDYTQCQMEAVKYVSGGTERERHRLQLHQQYGGLDSAPSDVSSDNVDHVINGGDDEIQGERAQVMVRLDGNCS